MLSFLLLLNTSCHFEPIPRGEKEGVLVAVRDWPEPVEFILLSTRGVILKRFQIPDITGFVSSIRLSPSSKKAVITSSPNIRQVPPGGDRGIFCHLINLENHTEKPILLIVLLPFVPKFVWSPDEAKLYYSTVTKDSPQHPIDKTLAPYQTWEVDLKTKKVVELKHLIGHRLHDISSDGKVILTGTMPNVQIKAFSDKDPARGYLSPFSRIADKPIADLTMFPERLSPNGKRVIGSRYTKEGEGYRLGHFTVDVDGKDSTTFEEPTAALGYTRYPCWTNGGKNIAMLWHEAVEVAGEKEPTFQFHIGIADQNGKKVKPIHDFKIGESIRVFDAR